MKRIFLDRTKIYLMGIALLFTSVNATALNFSISFFGSGASTTIDSVKVQNRTKGTSVTVQNSNVLNLMDAPNAVSQLNADMESVNIYPNPIQTSSTLTFNSAKTGMTH